MGTKVAKHGKRRGKQHKFHKDSRDSVLTGQWKATNNRRLRYLSHTVDVPDGGWYKRLMKGYAD